MSKSASTTEFLPNNNLVKYVLVAVGTALFMRANQGLSTSTMLNHNDMSLLRGSLGEIKDTNARLQKMVRTAKQMYEIPGFGTKKFFHEHFDSAFNVKYISSSLYEPDVRAALDQYDPTTDAYYKRDKDYYDQMSELNAGYKTCLINDRRLYVQFAGKEFGYGVFANIDIPVGTYLGDYTGETVSYTPNNDYTWTHPYEFEKNGKKAKLGIDSRHTGNIMRFVNAHVNDDKLNARVVFFVRDGEWAVGYYTTKLIRKGDQVIVSYGKAYWKSRNMYNPHNPESGPEKVEQDTK